MSTMLEIIDEYFRGSPMLIPQQVHQIQLSSPNAAQYGPVPNIGTIAFDTHQELLWVGEYFVRS